MLNDIDFQITNVNRAMLKLIFLVVSIYTQSCTSITILITYTIYSSRTTSLITDFNVGPPLYDENWEYDIELRIYLHKESTQHKNPNISNITPIYQNSQRLNERTESS